MKHTATHNQKNAAHDVSLFVQALKNYVYKRRYFFGAGFLTLLLVVLFFGFIRMAFFFIGLIIANVIVSYLGKSIPRFTTSLELTMFGTVLMAIAYGSKIGAIFGLLSAIIYYYGANRFSYFVILFAPLYAVIGLLVPFFGDADIFTIGMTSTIIYTSISSTLVIIIFNAKIDKTIGFAVINTFFNFIMFKYVAPLFVMIM